MDDTTIEDGRGPRTRAAFARVRETAATRTTATREHGASRRYERPAGRWPERPAHGTMDRCDGPTDSSS